MRPMAGIVVLIALAAGYSLAADGPSARPVARTAMLSDDVRVELLAALKKAERTAKPAFRGAAMTIEQARHYAGVPAAMTWQAEFGDWFVFSQPTRRGGPDSWTGIYFVQKGSNVVGYFHEKW